MTRKQGYQEIQGQRREDMEAGRERGRCDPSSKRGESDWTIEMMDCTAASNTHLSSGIINSKRDDQHTWSSSTAVLCWRRCSHHGGPKVEFTAGGLAEMTGAQELRVFA